MPLPDGEGGGRWHRNHAFFLAKCEIFSTKVTLCQALTRRRCIKYFFIKGLDMKQDRSNVVNLSDRRRPGAPTVMTSVQALHQTLTAEFAVVLGQSKLFNTSVQDVDILALATGLADVVLPVRD